MERYPKPQPAQPSQRGPNAPACEGSASDSTTAPAPPPQQPNSAHLPQLPHPHPIPAHLLQRNSKLPLLLCFGRIVDRSLVLLLLSLSYSLASLSSLPPPIPTPRVLSAAWLVLALLTRSPPPLPFRLRRGNWSSTMASNVWHNWTTLRFLTGFLPYLEAGAEWFGQVREALKVKLMGYNNNLMRRPSPHVTHKIKMASMHMSMDDISKTYKITPVRR